MSSGVDVRIDGWDIRGRWFGVVVGDTPRLGELRHGETIHGSRASAGEQARDDLGAAGLEAADRVRRFELDAHGAPEAGLQRLAAVQRSVGGNRVDHPASRPDPGRVQARLLHDTAA